MRLDELRSKLDAQQPTQAPPAAEIIDGSELCRRLGISEPSLIRWRRKRKIPFFRVGSHFRYNWLKVLEALEN